MVVFFITYNPTEIKHGRQAVLNLTSHHYQSLFFIWCCGAFFIMAKTALLILSGFLFLYLTNAFINWDVNPQKWSEDARAATMIFGCIVGLIFKSLSILKQEEDMH